MDRLYAMMALCVKWQRRERGAALLFVIGALLLLGAVGAGVAVIRPSALQSKLEQEAGARAFYNAQAGNNFVLSMYNSKSGSNFVNNTGINTNVTYVLSGNDTFTFELEKNSSNSNLYNIANLSGSVRDASNSIKYAFIMYGATHGEYHFTTEPGGGGGETVPVTIPPFDQYQLFTTKTLNIDTSGKITGNVYGDTIEFNGGSQVYGSVVQTSSTETLAVRGSYIGGTGQIIYSNSSISLSSNSVVGTVYARGNVVVEWGTVTGNIYADGDVYITGGATVTGNIYATGTVTIQTGKVVGTIYSAGNVIINNGSSVSYDINSQGTVTINNGKVGGIVHYTTGFSACSYCKYGGSDTNPVAVAATPAALPTYTVPDHVCPSPNQSPSSINVAYTAPSYNAQYVFTGYDDIDTFLAYQDITSVGGSSICFDLSGGGYLTMSVLGTFNLAGNLYVKTTSGNTYFQSNMMVKNLSSSKYSYASKVYLDSCSTSTMEFAGNYDWFGTIYATKDIDFGSSGTIIGAFYSSEGSINVTGGSTTTFVESDYAKAHWGDSTP